jgi:hypothetical protein
VRMRSYAQQFAKPAFIASIRCMIGKADTL